MWRAALKSAVQPGGTAQIQSIQWLRGVAALAVAAFHVSLQTGQAFVVGTAGVDVFFVVSGFIMWTISAQQSPAAFAINRIVRIAPLYWLATGVMIFGALAGLFPSVVLTAQHIFGSLFFIPHVSPSNGEVWPLLVQGWTLNYEMFFYAIFALALFAPRAVQPWILACVLAVLALVGIVARPSGVLSAFYTDGMILEFGAGVLLAWALQSGLRMRRGDAALLIIASIGGLAFVLLEGHWAPRFIEFGGPAVALVAGAVGLEMSDVSFNWRPATFLGDISYSLYLFHTFAIAVVAKLLDFSAMPVLGVVLGLGASIVVAIIAYFMFERPMAAVLRPQRRRAFWDFLIRLTRPDAPKPEGS